MSERVEKHGAAGSLWLYRDFWQDHYDESESSAKLAALDDDTICMDVTRGGANFRPGGRQDSDGHRWKISVKRLMELIKEHGELGEIPPPTLPTRK